MPAYFSPADLAGLADYGVGTPYDSQFVALRQYADDGNIDQALALANDLQGLFANDRARMSTSDVAIVQDQFQSLLAYIQSRVPGADARLAQWNANVDALQRSVAAYDASPQAKTDQAFEDCMAKLRQQNPGTETELLGPSYCRQGDPCIGADLIPGVGTPLGWICRHWMLATGIAVGGVGLLYAAPFLIGRYRAIKAASA